MTTATTVSSTTTPDLDTLRFFRDLIEAKLKERSDFFDVRRTEATEAGDNWEASRNDAYYWALMDTRVELSAVMHDTIMQVIKAKYG